MDQPKPASPAKRGPAFQLAPTDREGPNTTPSSLMTIPARQSAAPSDQNEPNAPFFVKALGYSLLVVVALALACSAGFVWLRHGAAMAVEMLSWGGTLNPLTIAAFIGPAIALIFVGKWMQWRVHRLKDVANDRGKTVGGPSKGPVRTNGVTATPRRMAQTTNLSLEKAADSLVASVMNNADPLQKAAILLADKDRAVADGLSRILAASETVARLKADDRT